MDRCAFVVPMVVFVLSFSGMKLGGASHTPNRAFAEKPPSVRNIEPS